MTLNAVWELLHPDVTPEHLGLIPMWISKHDPDPLWKQIDKNYGHGGGWDAFGKDSWKLDKNHVLRYLGDPPLRPLAKTTVRDETLYFYDHALVCITQKDGTFEVARID